MSRFLLPLAALLLIGSATAADIPFVFSDETPPLAGLGARELEELAASAPGLQAVPPLSQVPDDEIMQWTEVGGTTVSAGQTKSTAGELKEIFNSRVEPGNEVVHDTAMVVIRSYTGSTSLYQICAIYDYLNSGDDSTAGWSYFSDPRGVDLYYYANKTLINGQRIKASGAGDCDDFAILMASLVESIGGTTRIILSYNQSVGHAYTEVYLGSVNEAESQVEDVIEALKEHYGVTEVFTHLDTATGEVWLNLDWWPDGGVLHPGGPFFPGTKHIPLLIRDQYGKTPMRPPEGFQDNGGSDLIGLPFGGDDIIGGDGTTSPDIGGLIGLTVPPIYDHCTSNGGTVSGGNCVFSDGSSCELWAFYRGECSYNPEPILLGPLTLPSSAAAVYCENQGYESRNGRCYFPDGTSCEEWAF
ncbi:MAG: hypothetical protein JW986_09235, partial [Methanotrichaceae archaeon]|nr:hypothetical protein [Methanotrichaceae archaeon]